MKRSSPATMAMALLASSTLATAAFAAPQLERVRGTVDQVNGSSVVVKTADGQSKTVTLTPTSAVVWVAKSSLDNVKDGKFIGTATKGDNPPTALEVVIFPPSMKGTGEGHYDWDSITDTTAGSTGLSKSKMTNGTVASNSGSGSMTKSKMTNGTVSGNTAMMTKSKMTNGTVKSGTGTGGGKTIDVTYDNGKSLTINVPPSAPIVEFEKADKSIIKPGETLFSVAEVDGSNLNAKLVGIGKDGIKPPM